MEEEELQPGAGEMEKLVAVDADGDDDVLLPGFRFHPTDEELVGFYLKKKVQQKLLPIELISQLNIYNYDPWDLPRLAASGAKERSECYFYCRRDRKYRNSERPNRVTRSGFWKASGRDRPIFSSAGDDDDDDEGGRYKKLIIGLRKSLVFYRGKASKGGVKTDWMMHEFRLPAIPPCESSPPPPWLIKTRPSKNIVANRDIINLSDEVWTVCKIFFVKKTSSLLKRTSAVSSKSSARSDDQLIWGGAAQASPPDHQFLFNFSSPLSPTTTTTTTTAVDKQIHSTPCIDFRQPRSEARFLDHHHHHQQDTCGRI